MQEFLARVIVIPDKLSSVLYASLLLIAVQAEVWLAELANKYLGVQIDFTGVVAPLAAVVALLVVTLLKMFLERVVPEQWHPVVNSFLVWLAGFFGALALLHSLT